MRPGCTSCPAYSRNLQCGAEADAPEAQVHKIVRRHYRTVYRQIPKNHYVHVQMPRQAPIVHNVQIMTPPREYDCQAYGSQPSPSWSSKHTRWCCYKYRMFCPHHVVDKDIYHTVTRVRRVHVPVPDPMPAHAPIIHTIHHPYHVPSPPEYVHVNVPGPTVVKPVVVKESVPYPVPQPPQVINVNKPYPVHIRDPDRYVKVPVPSPPHVITHYHTRWNTVVDESHVVHDYDCHAGFSNWYHGWSGAKKSWCCAHRQMGCPGSWHGNWHHHVQLAAYGVTLCLQIR